MSHSRITICFSGFIGSSNRYSAVKGGANYVCLPDNSDPKYGVTYSSLARPLEDRHRARIDGIKYGSTELFKNRNVRGTALCAACRVTKKTSAITVPGTTECPSGWTLEYKGFLMAESSARFRTEFICVDEDAESTRSSSRRSTIGTLNYVESMCGTLNCTIFKAHYEMACAVCTI